MKAIAIIKQISLLLVMLLLIRCAVASSPHEINHYQRGSISGYAQIGPFLEGTTVRMTELRPTAVPLERIYNTRIRENNGAFFVSAQSRISDYVIMEVYGHYHNIMNGDESLYPITLYAISDLNQVRSVNLNVLTDLEIPRVKYLIQEEGLSIQKAKQKAQAEILTVFGMDFENMPPSEALDITGEGEANAILLAITVILQADYSALELERLLQTIGNDIRETGVLSNEKLIRDIWALAANISIEQISSNIISAYSALGIQISVPDFERHIIAFLENYSSAPTAWTLQAEVIDGKSAILHARVNPNGALTTIVFEYQTRRGEKNSVTADQGSILGITETVASAHVTDLLPAVTYHYRVKAYNINDTVYGREISFINPDDKDSQFTIGYHAGISIMEYSVSVSPDYKQLGFEKVNAKPGIGFSVGISLNYRLNKSLSLVSSPSFSFWESNVEFHPTTDHIINNIQTQKNDIFAFGLPIGLKYSLLTNRNARPYIVTGFMYVHDLHSPEGKPSSDLWFLFRTKHNDMQAVFGLGIKRQLKFVSVSAELKAFQGIGNLILPGDDYYWHEFEPDIFYNAIDQLRSRGLMFSLIIE